MSKRNVVILVGGVIVICLVLAAVSYIAGKNVQSSGAGSASSTAASATSSAGGIGVTVDGNSSGYSIKVIPDSATAASHPQIDRPLAFATDVTTDRRATLQDAADKLQKMLQSDSTNGGLWINLGTVRKMAGDYEGARQAWEYVAAVAPSDPTAIFNLADLYANFLNDPTTAETYYLKIVKLAPQSTDAYKDLAAIYEAENTALGKVKAEDILKQGIAVDPQAFDMQILLARLYRQEGDTASAKLEYADAANAAAAQKNDAAATSIRTEAAGL